MSERDALPVPGLVHLPRLSVLSAYLMACSYAEAPPSLTVTCGADLERIVTIEGDHAGRAGIGLVTEDNVFTVNNNDRSSIHVFDRGGRHLRTIGGAGDGPGEFRSIGDIRQLPDGRIAVFDQRTLRVTYFTPVLTVQSTHRLGVSLWPHGAAWDGEGGGYLAGRMVDRDHFGSPVVHVTENGSISSYIGDDETETEGRTMEPQVDWFRWPPPWMDDEPAEAPGGAVGDREPENAFWDMQFSERGHLWTLSQVTSPNWREGLSDGRVIDHAAWADNVLHVLDVTDGREICVVRFEDIFLFGGFTGSGILKSYEEDRLGQPTVTFWRLTIQP